MNDVRVRAGGPVERYGPAAAAAGSDAARGARAVRA